LLTASLTRLLTHLLAYYLLRLRIASCLSCAAVTIDVDEHESIVLDHGKELPLEQVERLEEGPTVAQTRGAAAYHRVDATSGKAAEGRINVDATQRCAPCRLQGAALLTSTPVE